jgi:membrane fusion protein, multidrug efflux system
MRTKYKLGVVAGMITFMVACGGGNDKKGGNDLNAKKAELTKLKDQSVTLGDQIRKLEEEIGKQDSTFAVKPQLVSTTAITQQNFTHYIDLQGKVTTENTYYVTPRNQGGQVKAVYVKEGDRVSKGKLLLKLDDAIIRQQIEQEKIRVSAAQDLYQRRKNLWDQKIGAEIDLINARNAMEGEQKQLDILNEQLSYSNVYAEASGVAEKVNVHTGEFFAPSSSATGAGIQIINDAELKATVDVPENYLSSVKKGTEVLIEVQDTKKQIKSKISVVSQLINANSRGFTAEAKIPSDPSLKPNQLVTVKIKDYAASNTIVIPMTTLQTDEKGKYVFVLENDKGKQVAKKKQVTVGQIYGEQIEVKSGLQTGEQLITQGYQSIYEGQTVTTQG